jgi:cation:H+ antiporter
LRQGKDGLALGNITGAMVFQSCIPVTFGVAFTTWVLQPIPLASALLAVIAGLWVYLLSLTNRLTASSLFFNGMLYLAFLLIVLRFA